MNSLTELQSGSRGNSCKACSDTEYAERIGEAIRLARLEKELTQEELGRMVGVRKSRISHIERGCCSITVPTMGKIFRALGITTASVDLGSFGKLTLW